jgi:hypothetical protein
MNVAGIYFLAGAALLASASARAQEPTADTPRSAAVAGPQPGADTPYASIVTRNMFGLVPIPPPDPDAGKPPVEPPPKITPNGIMTIFGRDQALFKVANKPKQGQQPKEDSYVLAEGERQDDIEVVKINHETSVITFNNHGTMQELPLVEAKDAGGPAGGPGGGPAPGRPGIGAPRPGFPGGLPPRRNPAVPGVASSGGNPNMGGGGNNFGGGNTSGAGFGSAGGQQSEANIEDQVMSAARQMALIEQNRIDTQEQVSQGLLPPLPPTPLTPDEAITGGGIGGAPLVKTPELPATTHR